MIGIQSHMHGGVWGNRQIWQVCERFARFGVPLHFTETTIYSAAPGKERKIGWPIHARGRGPAGPRGGPILHDAVFASGGRGDHLVGLLDLHAWKNAPAGYLCKDMTPKPAYDALEPFGASRLLPQTMETGSNGEAAFRGFLGEYSVSIQIDGKTTAAGQYKMTQGKENRWVITLK